MRIRAKRRGLILHGWTHDLKHDSNGEAGVPNTDHSWEGLEVAAPEASLAEDRAAQRCVAPDESHNPDSDSNMPFRISVDWQLTFVCR